MKVLSLFDGMACGALALMSAGVEIESYDAFEIDKYAVKTSSHNFPFIKHHGDVFKADFTQFEGVDLVCGGSPCTYWSIAQKNNRETVASGLGWELFSQYVRAVKEAKPKFFIYENNKSMSKAIRQSIDETFGFEAVLINSALVSAQNRQRLYWVGRRNEDGTYSKVNVEQPEDRGIVLRDILESGVVDREKSYPLLVSHQGNARDYFKKQHAQIVCEPVRIPPYGNEDKARPLNALYPNNCGGFEHRMFSENPNKQQVDMVAEPIYVGELPEHKGVYRNGKQPSQQYRVYSIDGKSVACDRDSRKYVSEPIPVFATVCEWDEDGKPIKAVSTADGKVYTVYEVKDGFITIKGKKYPIKLKDGYYIIRKLTVRECMRLQTVPEWYEFPVSDSQAYKMLGNGWTVEVIAHLVNSCLSDNGEAQLKIGEQMRLF